MGISWAKKWDIGYGMVYFSATTPNYLWHVGVSENAIASIVTSIKFGRATGVLNYEKISYPLVN